MLEILNRTQWTFNLHVYFNLICLFYSVHLNSFTLLQTISRVKLKCRANILVTDHAVLE